MPHRLLPLPLLLVCLGMPGVLAADSSSGSDPAAVRVAERTVEAMGGAPAFERTRLFRFDFAVSRGDQELARHHHWWDRWTGDYRVEGKTREGQGYRVDFNTKTRAGQAWLDGEVQEGERLAELLEMGYGRFINDTYWFLMPWKWLDPGVHLGLEEPRSIDGTLYDVVSLRFDSGIGLTSRDRYWGLVSQDSGLMERWEFVLQQEDGEAGSAEPRQYAWTDWKVTSTGLRLSTHKGSVDGDLAIHFPVLETYGDRDREGIEAFFAAPSPGAPLPPSEAVKETPESD